MYQEWESMKKRVLAALSAFVILLCTVAVFPNTRAKAAFAVDLDENQVYLDKVGAVFMLNTDTGVTVYEKNSTEMMYPASTTKVMTALLAIELCPDMNTMVTVDDRIAEWLLGADASSSGLQGNERLSMYDLLCGLLLPSGNDAAFAIASFLGDGDVEKFVAYMNEKALLLGCVNTHFKNPHGLHEEGHYTCARDLTIIAQKAMEYPVFAEIVQKYSYTTAPSNKAPNGHTYYNTNYLMNVNYSSTYYYSYCKGIKTGYTNKAGMCFVGYATRNGYNYICVCLGAPKTELYGGDEKYNASFITCKELFDWAFNNLSLKEVVSANSVMAEVTLEQAWNKDALTLVPETSFTTLLPTSVTGTAVMKKFDLPESVTAPVRKGDVVGTVTLAFAGDELGTVNLVASESVERSEILYLLSIVNKIVSSTAFVIIAILAVIAIGFYIVWSLVLGNNTGRKVRRYR